MSGNQTGAVLCYAASVEAPADGLTTQTPWLPIKSDQFGALWTAISDPVTGLDVEVERLSSDPFDPTAPIISARALMTGAIQLVQDPTVGAFQQVERGYLDSDVLGTDRIAQLTSSVPSAWNPSAGAFQRLRALSRGQNITGVDFNAGILATNSCLYLSNAAGGTHHPMLSANTALDAIATSSENWLRTAGMGYAFNGGTFDRLGTASSANLAAQTGNRAQLAAHPGEWTLTHAPIANTQASATRAAGGANVRHVLRSINATLIGVAAIAAPISVVVRDGATGVGPILWADQLFAPAAGTSDRVTLTGLNIVGSSNTAMTIEFIAAPGATNFEAVAATGYSGTASA